MTELDAEDFRPAKVETEDEDDAVEPGNEKVANLTDGSAAGRETDLTPSDPMDPSNCAEGANKTPRKLIEDEKREHGRIAWPVWRTYLTVRCFRRLPAATNHGIRRWVAVCGVRQIDQQVVQS